MNERKKIRIAKKFARIILCSSKDNVSDSVMLVRKEGVYQCWAQVEYSNPVSASFGGYFNADAPTHKISINYRPDMVITNSGWVYLLKRKSQPQWLKIMALAQEGQFLRLSCRLTEAGDSMAVPAGIAELAPVKQNIDF